MMKDIKPLLSAGFPDHWEEICALAMVRVPGNVPLKWAKDAWEKLYNAEDIHPSLNQKNLTAVMRDVGVNRAGQNVLFRELADMSKQLVYDLSSMFSRSMSINQAEKGYNKDKIQVPQINLALLCSADTGLPTMIRSLPGMGIRAPPKPVAWTERNGNAVIRGSGRNSGIVTLNAFGLLRKP